MNNRPDVDKIYTGDSLAVMRTWPDNLVDCCVTSPPYWTLRDYGVNGQVGMEKTPEEYIAKMVEIFREVRRVLKNDGTLWLNIGDCYNAAGRKGQGVRLGHKQNSNRASRNLVDQNHPTAANLKEKDLVGIPWLLAFALRADGWYLRSDIIWSKPDPMPESVKDRPTRAHEYLFLLSSNAKYFYNAEAIQEPGIYFDLPNQNENGYKDAGNFDGKYKRPDKQRGHSRRHAGFNDRWDRMDRKEQCAAMRNKRDVWTVAAEPFSESHFATFPTALIKPCILAGCHDRGIVLDPFMGSGTTALVASQLNRQFIGIEINKKYIAIAEKRIAGEMAQLKIC